MAQRFRHRSGKAEIILDDPEQTYHLHYPFHVMERMTAETKVDPLKPETLKSMSVATIAQIIHYGLKEEYQDLTLPDIKKRLDFQNIAYYMQCVSEALGGEAPDPDPTVSQMHSGLAVQ